MGQKRIAYIDYTKALGMMLIILAHTTYLFSEVSSYGIPESCHVPIFFIAVGLVHAYISPKGSFKDFFWKRFYGLFVPYIVFSVINSILKLGTFFFLHRLTVPAIKDEMFEFFVNGNGPVWFLGVLFAADFLYVLSIRYCNHWSVVFAILGGILLYSVGDCNNKWIYPIIRIMGAYSLIVLGSYSKRLFEMNNGWRLSIFLTSIGLWICLLFWGERSNDYSFRPGYFFNAGYSIPLMLSGSLGIIMLTTFLKKNIKWLEYIGNNSLCFLVIHPILQMAYSFSIGGWINNLGHSVQFVVFIIMYSLFIAVCVPVNEYLLKECPWILGKAVARKC